MLLINRFSRALPMSRQRASRARVKGTMQSAKLSRMSRVETDTLTDTTEDRRALVMAAPTEAGLTVAR